MAETLLTIVGIVKIVIILIGDSSARELRLFDYDLVLQKLSSTGAKSSPEIRAMNSPLRRRSFCRNQS
ncbi:hypothetical protein PIB30_081312 [Stylosanthes scabra]|uniref:Uncharacterized protein n=1 Tax=Stylosanthes scabra TaxID=79078 RepID=A0ABU6WSI7_9FABA|nr:hypothetical protein [Stylosanthes scabra]